MDLAYLIVGIARNEEKDFSIFYEQTQASVYGLALSFTRDRALAKEITVESYRRVKEFARDYDTDTNPYEWLLTITKNLSLNAIYDENIKNSQSLDNLSNEVKYIISESKDERSSILVLRALTDLSFNEIARLLFYYNISLKNEYKRAIKATKKKLKLQEEEILGLIKKEFANLHKLFPLIISDKETLAKDLSHDSTLLEQEDSLSSAAKQSEYLHSIIKGQKRKKGLKAFALACLGLALILLMTFIVSSLVKNHKNLMGNKGEGKNHRLAMVEFDNKLYFQNYEDGSRLYVFDLEKKIKTKIIDYPIKAFIIYKEDIFFQNKDNNRLYKFKIENKEVKEVTSSAVSSFLVEDNHLYYSTADKVIKADLNGKTQDILLIIEDNSIFLYSLAIYEDKVYFSGGAGRGIYSINESYKDFNILFFEPAYNLSFKGGYIYFGSTWQQVFSKNLYPLLRYNLEEGQYEDYSKSFLNSGSFYLNQNHIYFDGFVKGQTGIKEKKGLYRINISTRKEDLLIERESKDLYVSDNYIYSYNPGLKNNLLAYEKANLNNVIIIF